MEQKQYLVTKDRFSALKKAKKQKLSKTSNSQTKEQRIIHTDSDAPSDDPNDADLSEFTQPTPRKEVCDEFEENNECSTSAKLVQQNHSVTSSSVSKYQSQFKSPRGAKKQTHKNIYKGLDKQFWHGYNQQKPSYWRLNIAQDPISRAIQTREKYASNQFEQIKQSQVQEYINNPIEKEIGIGKPIKLFKLKCEKQHEITELQKFNYEEQKVERNRDPSPKQIQPKQFGQSRKRTTNVSEQDVKTDLNLTGFDISTLEPKELEPKKKKVPGYMRLTQTKQEKVISTKARKSNLAEIKNIRENMKKKKMTNSQKDDHCDEEKSNKTRESVFERMKQDQKKWREKKEGKSKSPPLAKPKSPPADIQKKKRPPALGGIGYESSSSYSSQAFDDVSDSISEKAIRPSRLKISMKADNVKKKKRSTLQYYLHSLKKTEFIRKSNLIEYEESSDSSSQISVEESQFCVARRDIKKEQHSRPQDNSFYGDQKNLKDFFKCGFGDLCN